MFSASASSEQMHEMMHPMSFVISLQVYLFPIQSDRLHSDNYQRTAAVQVYGLQYEHTLTFCIILVPFKSVVQCFSNDA